jgi:hypothetical protein
MLLILTGVSIAGLLSMHGLQLVVTTIDQTHASHAQPADHHGAIGLCVFVVALTGMGMALSKANTTARPARHPHRPASMTPTVVPRTSGPPLLHRLCVLRH